jgi:hypothetical protein
MARGLAHAGCDIIPQAQLAFRGALGSTDRPYSTPGDLVDVGLQQCDGASPGFQPLPDDHVVTLVFKPLRNGPRRAVILTTQDCEAPNVEGLLTACVDRIGKNGEAACVRVNQSGPVGLALVPREDGTHLNFRFPDTRNRFASIPQGLAGPVAIAVSRTSDASLPCGLAKETCAGDLHGAISVNLGK